MTTFRAGDRVHFPGDPNDRGTLIPHEHDAAFVIVWDEWTSDGRDLDECYADGTLYTVGGGRVVLVDRPSARRAAQLVEDLLRELP